MSDGRTIQGLLQKGELGGLVKQVLKAHEVNRALKQHLPEPYQESCEVSQVEGGSVTLDVPNASVLTIMRYQAPELLSKLRQQPNLAGLVSIKCRIKPPEAPKAVPAPKINNLSIDDNAKAILKETAERIEDEALRAALLKLASD